MISRKEFLGWTAAVAAGAASALPQNAPTAAGREAEARANTPHKAQPIMTMDQPALLKILTSRTATEFEKAKACQRLAVVGDETAVPALAALLGDRKLSHYARYGLEPIPGEKVDAAFREALGRLDGALRIGVINSIGRRKDKQALATLARLRHDSDQATAEAAETAIARARQP